MDETNTPGKKRMSHTSGTNSSNAQAPGVLEALSKKYLWWESDGFTEDRLIAQVMNIGDFNDMQAVEKELGAERLREVLDHAEAGWFSPRSWSFWHYRLGATEIGNDVPPMRTRSFGR